MVSSFVHVCFVTYILDMDAHVMFMSKVDTSELTFVNKLCKFNVYEVMDVHVLACPVVHSL